MPFLYCTCHPMQYNKDTSETTQSKSWHRKGVGLDRRIVVIMNREFHVALCVLSQACLFFSVRCSIQILHCVPKPFRDFTCCLLSTIRVKQLNHGGILGSRHLDSVTTKPGLYALGTEWKKTDWNRKGLPELTTNKNRLFLFYVATLFATVCPNEYDPGYQKEHSEVQFREGSTEGCWGAWEKITIHAGQKPTLSTGFVHPKAGIGVLLKWMYLSLEGNALLSLVVLLLFLYTVCILYLWSCLRVYIEEGGKKACN